jgi:hypothetical protein
MPCSFVISDLAKEQRAGRGIFRPAPLSGLFTFNLNSLDEI